MRFLFLTTGSQATVYAVAPLATAVQNAGHEILLAGNAPVIEWAESIEVPVIATAPEPIRHFVRSADPVDVGRGFARMTSAGLPALRELARNRPPDLVVGGSMSYAAGLLATELEIPYVRHAEYIEIPISDIDPGAEEGLRPELRRSGMEGLPEPDLFLDVTPPSMRPHSPNAQLMRWIPRNPQRPLEAWMYTRTPGRPRVLITSGTHFRMLPGDSMRRLADRLTGTGAEVLVAAPDAVREELGAELDDARIGWIPMDVVAPTCDLVIHHGGASTTMTTLAAGVPQVIIPPNTHTKAIARALTDRGVARTVPHLPGQDPADAIAAAARDIFGDPHYAQRTKALADEIGALPTPAETVRTMEELTTD